MTQKASFNPLFYHHHHAEKIEDIPFWVNLARASRGPILELGCGTGRLISHFAQLGQRVIGLDINYGMLAFLKKNLPNYLLESIDVFQADLGEFRLTRKFSLIILACNTLSSLEKRTRMNAFLRIQEHITKDGLFAASVPNPLHLERLPSYGEPEVEDVISHPVSGNPLQISSEWEKQDQSITFRWFYDHLFPDGRVERHTIETKHFVITAEQYQAELESVDLNYIEMIGDYDLSDYNQDSPLLILCASKSPRF